MEKIVTTSKPLRDEKGRLLPGQTANWNGRPPDTPEQKIEKKAMREFIEEHKERLAEALPKISPVLISKAVKGNLFAIKEVHDRVMGKPITMDDVPSNNYFLTIVQQIINEPKTIIERGGGEVQKQTERQKVETKESILDNKQRGKEGEVYSEYTADLLRG